MSSWSCFSNYGQVLLVLAKVPDIRLRDLAAHLGVTERAVHRVVDDLVEFGAVTRIRQGRRVHYTIDRHLPLPHPMQASKAAWAGTGQDLSGDQDLSSARASGRGSRTPGGPVLARRKTIGDLIDLLDPSGEEGAGATKSA